MSTVNELKYYNKIADTFITHLYEEFSSIRKEYTGKCILYSSYLSGRIERAYITKVKFSDDYQLLFELDDCLVIEADLIVDVLNN
ncbi:hypothetical protein N0S44_000443 [Escherichia coli]|nr:hypothetical protein [Escherichia coli]EJR1979288.1 hypothetical protein [Escherichia coli]UTS53759.1 hypothetical protein UES1_392 [Escherichia phage UE-S1]